MLESQHCPDSRPSQVDRRLLEAKTVLSKLEKMKLFDFENSGNFSQTVMALTKNRGYNKTTFCAKTLLSEKTYNLIKQNSMQSMPRPETVMQICIGLELGVEYGELLFEKAGYRLRGSEVLTAYRTILLVCKKINIIECNKILEQLGLPTLAKHSIKKNQ